MADRPVAVIVDSTLDVPDAVAGELDIAVVPLTVHVGNESFLDHVELTSAPFLARLTGGGPLPKTSQPPPARFEETFRTALAGGRDVLCLTLSADLSGTLNSARLAAEAIGGDRIRVIDSRSVSIGGGFPAIAAARAARDGATLEQATALVEAMIPRVTLYAALDTLEFLHKGGRIGRASALVGSLLSIKPIIQIRDGHVQPVERVRTWRRAMDRLGALTEALAPLEHVGVMHVGNPTDAGRLAERLAPIAPGGDVLIGELGPVVATYGGPGLVGVVTVRAG